MGVFNRAVKNNAGVDYLKTYMNYMVGQMEMLYAIGVDIVINADSNALISYLYIADVKYEWVDILGEFQGKVVI